MAAPMMVALNLSSHSRLVIPRIQHEGHRGESSAEPTEGQAGALLSVLNVLMAVPSIYPSVDRLPFS